MFADEFSVGEVGQRCAAVGHEVAQAGRAVDDVEQLQRTQLKFTTSAAAPAGYHIISYQKFIVRPLLREPRPRVHYKSHPNAETATKTQNQLMLKA